MFIEILFNMLLFKGGVLIYAEHCIYIIIFYIFCYYFNMKVFVNLCVFYFYYFIS